jgi:hypothetical protein
LPLFYFRIELIGLLGGRAVHTIDRITPRPGFVVGNLLFVSRETGAMGVSDATRQDRKSPITARGSIRRRDCGGAEQDGRLIHYVRSTVVMHGIPRRLIRCNRGASMEVRVEIISLPR